MNYSEFQEILLREWPDLTPVQLSRFAALEGLYRDWNAKINVISRKDMDNFYEHHVLHSLAIAMYWRKPFVKVLDLGTGGGFPGIPLAILFPESSFTLCDSIAKKIKVVSEVAMALGLDNVLPVCSRAENLRGNFDVVVSRAVTSLDNFFPWVKDKFSDSILYLKGGDINPEIASMIGKYRLPKGCVHSWRVDSKIKGEYFAEKFVIQIEKNYLCTPNSE